MYMAPVKARTLVLGGGIGGVVIATELRKKLSREHSVVLVERESDFRFAPSYLWLMTNDRTAPQISRRMEGVKKRGIELLQGNVTKISPDSLTAEIDGTSHAADYMVV